MKMCDLTYRYLYKKAMEKDMLKEKGKVEGINGDFIQLLSGP